VAARVRTLASRDGGLAGREVVAADQVVTPDRASWIGRTAGQLSRNDWKRSGCGTRSMSNKDSGGSKAASRVEKTVRGGW
jgi:hypothetical protein